MHTVICLASMPAKAKMFARMGTICLSCSVKTYRCPKSLTARNEQATWADKIRFPGGEGCQWFNYAKAYFCVSSIAGQLKVKCLGARDARR